MQVCGPQGHESAADGKKSFNHTSDGLGQGWGDVVEGNDGIAGGEVDLVLTGNSCGA